jgi:glutamate 5-kinase
VLGRGITAWSSEQVERCKGKKSAEVRSILGGDVPSEVVHRDDLMIFHSRETPGGREGAAS